MNIFDLILVQPIFNVLMLIYGLIPGQDLGVAIIIFTIIVRLAMWPMVKKQLHQTKVMRQLQPKLTLIKKKAKGNRQLESQMMLELYREHGINPFSQIGLLLVQLPVFIALFSVVRLITEEHSRIGSFTYDFLEQIPAVSNAIATNVNHHLFGFIDLGKHATESGGSIYWPLFVLAVLAAVLQYYQTKQLLPQPKEKKRLRDLLKEQASGKEVDQAELSALMTGKMSFLFPALTFLISMYLAGALVVYLVVSSAVAIIQQDRALKQDETDLEKLSEKTKTKVSKAKEAVVVDAPPAAKKKGRTTAKKKKRS
ncbi:MAG TPA: YidC/Oxa1 family membrane protein insertase [Candidatus Saccharimonadales bacterium]|nr:YidC/Oxa1 family membrane protein insertase [Candidatus Saccharimonadales bacterium]